MCKAYFDDLITQPSTTRGKSVSQTNDQLSKPHNDN